MGWGLGAGAGGWGLGAEGWRLEAGGWGWGLGVVDPRVEEGSVTLTLPFPVLILFLHGILL